MNNLTIEQRNRIFKYAPEGYDWSAKSSSQLWRAFNKRPHRCFFIDSITGLSDNEGFWDAFIDDPAEKPPTPGKPIGCFTDISVSWIDSLITRPTDEELETLKK